MNANDSKARRAEQMAFLIKHAHPEAKDPRKLLGSADDAMVEMVFHKVRSARAELSPAERAESVAWLRSKGSKPFELPMSPDSVQSLGLIPAAGTGASWASGPPELPASGWRNVRAYLPAALPEGWAIVGHRTDGALMLTTADGHTLVLSGTDKRGKRELLATVGRDDFLRVAAGPVLEHVRGVGPFTEVDRAADNVLMIAPLRTPQPKTRKVRR